MKEEAESLLKARDELQERLRHMDAEAKRSDQYKPHKLIRNTVVG